MMGFYVGVPVVDATSGVRRNASPEDTCLRCTHPRRAHRDDGCSPVSAGCDCMRFEPAPGHP